jgi:hypothetical protein
MAHVFSSLQWGAFAVALTNLSCIVPQVGLKIQMTWSRTCVVCFFACQAPNSNDMIKDFAWAKIQSLLCMHTDSQVYGMKAGFSLPTIHSFRTLQHTSGLLEVDFQYNKNYSSSSALSRTCYNYCQTMVVWVFHYLSHILHWKWMKLLILCHACLMNHSRYLLLEISFVYLFVIMIHNSIQCNVNRVSTSSFSGCLWGWSVYPLKKHFYFAFLLWA